MNETPRSDIFRDLQGLRGLAVLLVVLYHAATPGLSGGYVGVDIFFVISGYLITGLLFQERQRTGTIDFPQFYGRRARRLLPAVSVTILVTLACSWFVFAPIEQRVIASSAFATTFYFSNVWFARASNNYFGDGAEGDPFLHTWSLAVEEQFYMVWPALLFLAARNVTEDRVRLRLVRVLAATSAISLGTCVYLTSRNQPWAFFSMPTRMWEFGLGALSLLLLPTGSQLRPRTSLIMNWLGALLIVWAATRFDGNSTFPGYVALIPAIGACLLLGAGRATTPGFLSRLLSRAPIVWLGDISYSWYLWHWPALVAARQFIGSERLAAPLAVIGSLALATVSYRLVENPIRRSPALTTRVWATLAGAAVLTIAAGSVALLAHHTAATEMMTPQQQVYSDVHDEGGPTGACNASFGQVDLPSCVFGDLRAPRTILLFGDSHAQHWFPAVERLAVETNARLVSLTKSLCPSVAVTVYLEARKRLYDECDSWRAAMLSRITALRPSLGGISNFKAMGVDSAGGPIPLSPSDWQHGVDALLSHLNAADIPVLVIHDTPYPGMDVPICLARAAWRGASSACAFSREAARARSRATTVAEDQSVARHPDAFAMDFTDVICPSARCNTERDGYVLYRDESHLGARFSRSLGLELLRGVKDYGARRPASRVNELFAPTTD